MSTPRWHRHARRTAKILLVLGTWMALATPANTKPLSDRFVVHQWTTDDGLPQNSIVDIHQTQDGYLWLATFGGLVRFNGHSFLIFDETTPGLASNRFISLFEDDSQKLWIGSEHDGVFTYQAGHFEACTADQGCPTGEINSIGATQTGELVFGTPDGFFKRQGRALVRTNPDATHDKGFAQRSLGIDSSKRDWVVRDGVLWVEGQGEPLRPFGADGELLEIRKLLEDREGSFWVGTNRRGLFQLRERAVSRFAGRNMSGFSITGDGQDGVWAGVNCTDIVHIGPEGERARRDLSGGATGCVSTVLRDKAGVFWVAFQNELVRLDGDRKVTVIGSEALGSAELSALYEPPGGGLLVGTRGAGIFERTKDGTFEPSRELSGIPDNRVQTFTQVNADSPLWVGTLSGPARFEGGRWTHWTEADGAPPGNVRAIHIDDTGAVWVGTYGGGLGRFDGERWARFTLRDGLADNVVSHIAADDHGNFWLNGNRGVSQVSRRDLETFARGELEEIQSIKMSNDEGNGGVQPSGWRSSDGALWFPSIQSVIRVDPQWRRAEIPAPTVSIERVLLGREVHTLALRGPLKAARDARTLEIAFAGLSHLEFQPALTRYRLIGADPRWSVPSRRTHATWPNLPPGKYRFEVSARNTLGVWSAEPASIDIIIPAHFYETQWFRFLGLLALLGLALGLHRWRLRRLADQHRALQHEIEQRQRAQEAQRSLQAQLTRAQRLETLGRLAGGIAHDFNNVLTALQGAAQLQALQLDDGDFEAAREQGEFLTECIQSAVALTGQLLAFGRRPKGDPSPVHMPDAVRAMDKMLRRLMGSQVHFQLSLDERAHPILIDPSQFEQILLNLCLNANDAMPEGGVMTIRITTETLDAPDGDVPAGVWGVLEVQDQGVGMSEAVQSQLFEPFFTTRGDHGGTGLGLSVVKDAVNGAGGHIRVQSAAGLGTRFTLHLPCATVAAAPQAAPTAPSTKAPSRSATLILVCDDDDHVRHTTTQALRRLGHDVLDAANGEQLSARLDTVDRTPELLVTDVLMPGDKGPVVARKLRARFPDLKVLFISGYTDDIALDDGQSPPPFLQKPFSIDALEAKVVALLES